MDLGYQAPGFSRTIFYDLGIRSLHVPRIG